MERSQGAATSAGTAVKACDGSCSQDVLELMNVTPDTGALFLLDALCVIVWFNLEGERLLRSGVGLTRRNGRLCSVTSTASERLERAVARAAAVLSDGVSAPAQSFKIDDGPGCLQLSVSPLYFCPPTVPKRPSVAVHVTKLEAPALVLSARQREVLRLLAQGRMNKEIAEGLGCSVNTVKNHLSELYRKLGCRTRTECVGKAREHGLL